MFVAILKLIDVGARAGFMILATFALPLALAGQFGILLTLTALFAFAFGWERYIDIQRRFVGGGEAEFDAAVRRAFHLFAFNYALLLPFFLFLIAVWAHIAVWPLLVACAVIVIGEHHSNLSYQLGLADPRYARLLFWGALKNIALLLFVAVQVLLAPAELTLATLIIGWAAASAVTTLVMIVDWLRFATPRDGTQSFDWTWHIFDQHRASLTHFAIGGLNVLMLQIDRLVVGALLPFAQVGVYFRHALLISCVYQFFNIGSYNRVLPTVFAALRTRPVAAVAPIIGREMIKVAGLIAAALIALWLANELTDGFWAERFSLSLSLTALMMLGALARIAADFNSLILNARMRENLLIRHQAVSFAIGTLSMFVLTYLFGLYGTAAAAALASVIYFLLNRVAVMKLAEPISQ